MEEKFQESKQRQARYLKVQKAIFGPAPIQEACSSLNFRGSERGKEYLNPGVKNFRENEGLPFGYTRMFGIGEMEVFWVKRNELPEQNYLFDEANSKFIEYNGFARISRITRCSCLSNIT